MAAKRRAMGFCVNSACEQYMQGENVEAEDYGFVCDSCGFNGHLERERGVMSGKSNLFSEVRVEFGFDPVNACYQEIARVKDQSVIGRKNVYTLSSPFIQCREQALKVAETVLRKFNEYDKPAATSLSGKKVRPRAILSHGVFINEIANAF